MTICMYENWDDSTQPGTEINVTPLRLAPIIPNATTYHGDFLSPKKKVRFAPLLDVRMDITIRTRK